MNFLLYVSYFAFTVGLLLAGIWVSQEIFEAKILDDAGSGAIGFLLFGLTANLISRKQSTNRL